MTGAPPAPRQRLSGAAVEMDDATLDRLRSACGSFSTDAGDLDAAGQDWWPLAMTWARQGWITSRAGAVASPGSVDEVAAVLAICNAARVPVTPAAGRSGVCGGAVPVHGGVVLDLGAMSGIVEVDDESLVVTVLPGTSGDALEHELCTAHGLTLGHWPQSMALSTVGGWLACRSAGQYSTRYGKIEDMVAGLEVVLADGHVIRTGGAPRAAVGPDLGQLFVGSEGTLGVITEATLRAHPTPRYERRAAYGFASFADGMTACRRVLRRGAHPAVLRLYDDMESRRSFDIDGKALLLVLDEGEPADVDAGLAVVDGECGQAVRLPDELVGRWLAHRNDVSLLQHAVAGGMVVDTVEVAARWRSLPGIHQAVCGAVGSVEDTIAVSTHLSHSYTDGACLYFTFAGRPSGGLDGGDAYYRQVWDAAMQAVLAGGGAISHHHGIGFNRGRFVRAALGPAFDVLAAVKTALDPSGILNPGKLGLPDPFGGPVWP